jgi:hypothetical protein
MAVTPAILPIVVAAISSQTSAMRGGWRYFHRQQK